MGRAIGVDVGGTKVAVAAVDGTGAVRAAVAFPTESSRGFRDGLARIAAAVETVASRAGWAFPDLDGIGIGAAGPVDPVRGTFHNPYTLPGWEDADPVTPLRERFGVPVRLENDADAAALGEAVFGAGRGASPLVLLTFGTGIGGGAIVEGRIYRGAGGEHPEMGHLPALPDGPECYCGARGCFESLASGTAIEAAGREAGLPGSREVFRAAERGGYPAELGAAARRIIDRALDAAASAAWAILHTYLPERLVLGGGLMEDRYDLFAAAIRGRIARAALFHPGRTAVVRAELGVSAGAVGAACLVLPPGRG